MNGFEWLLKTLSESFDPLRTNGDEIEVREEFPAVLIPRQARD